MYDNIDINIEADSSVLILNDEQLDAVGEIINWIASDEREYILEGRAGTGKTTTIGQIPFEKAVGVAVSHKAKEVLFQSFNENMDCFTVAQVLGQEKLQDLSTGKITFGTSDYADKKELIKILKSIKGLIIIIDECSMISTSIRKQLLRLYPYAKMLYLGDPYQIPPIYKPEDKRETIFQDLTIAKAHLTKNQRCGEDNPLKNLLNSIVDSQKSGKDETNKWLGVNKNLNSNKVGYSVNTPISKFWVKDETFVVCFSNHNKREWNKDIREKIHGRTDPMCVGDRLIFNENIYVYDRGDLRRVHTNSDIIEVEEFDIESVLLHYYKGTQRQSITLKFFIINSDTTFYVPTHGADDILESIIKSTLKAARNSSGYTRKTIFKQYFKLLNYKSKTSFAYAITAHKSQGSTYQRVVVDYNDIMCRKFNSFEDRLKLFYVACSRAKEQVLIVK